MKKLTGILKTILSQRIIIAALMLNVFQSGSAYSVQDTIKLTALQDNTLYEDAAGSISNGQGKYLYSGKGSTGLIRRALVRFMLVEFLPPCSKILNVSLKMHLSGGAAANKTIQLRKIKESWGEGNSDAPGLEEDGTAAAFFDATWKHRYYNTDLWSSAGGEYSAVSSGNATVGGPGFYTWNSTPQMVSDVQEWADNQSAALGWLLLGDETASSTAKRFHSSESDTVTFVPEITVIYQTSNFGIYVDSFIEGFWDGTNMIGDTIKVKLHSSVSPYAVLDSDVTFCETYGGQFCFYNAPQGNYYISVHHRNTIETWSKYPLFFMSGDNQYYTFKDSASKAYGDNEVLKFSEYCFYSGDVNQDGTIDASDVSETDNDAFSSLSGYVRTDVTGDDFVDAADVSIVDNNAFNSVSVISP